MKKSIICYILVLALVLVVCTGCSTKKSVEDNNVNASSAESLNAANTDKAAIDNPPTNSSSSSIPTESVGSAESTIEHVTEKAQEEKKPVDDNKQEAPATEPMTAPATHEHTYTAVITKEATCSENGIITLTCSCGDSRTESTEKLPHTFVSSVVAPTDLAEGYTVHTCSKCGYSYTDTITAKLEHEHNYVLDTTSGVTREVTCENNGYKLYVCACGDTYIEIYEFLMHDFSESKNCKRCGKEYDGDEIVDFLTPNQEAVDMMLKYHNYKFISRSEQQ